MARQDLLGARAGFHGRKRRCYIQGRFTHLAVFIRSNPKNSIIMVKSTRYILTKSAILLVAGLVALHLRVAFAENSSPLTIDQFKQLATDNGTLQVLGQDILDVLKKRGFAFDWNYATIKALQAKGADDATIQRMEDLYQKTIHNTVFAAPLSLSASTNLANSVTNQTAFTTNFLAAAKSIRDFGIAVRSGATVAPALGGDVAQTGTNFEMIGNSLMLGATNYFQKTNSSYIPAFISAGAKFVSPYTIHVDGTNGTLEKSGDSTSAFIEFTLLDRYVLRPDSEEEVHGSFLGAKPISPFSHLPDVESHIGFSFANSSGPSTYTATTIAGGGDFYSDASLGLPFARWSNGAHRQQVTFELAGGVITEKSFMAVHPNAFAGLGYQAAFRPWYLPGTNHLSALLTGRVGVGWIDVPSDISKASTNITVAVSGGLPLFELKPYPTLGVSFLLPISDSIYLTVGGNAYMKDDPAPWNITVGATMPFDKLGSKFKAFIDQ